MSRLVNALQSLGLQATVEMGGRWVMLQVNDAACTSCKVRPTPASILGVTRPTPEAWSFSAIRSKRSRPGYTVQHGGSSETMTTD